MLRFNKPCEAEDFRDPELLAVIRDMYPAEAAALGPSWPAGREMRKQWEVAMAVLAMRTHGVLHGDAAVLGVGAGKEQTVFYLTNYVRWVFATDMYAAPGLWRRTAPPEMLVDPVRAATLPFNPRRLVTQHMDGRDLRYEEATFDAIFSSSSIEHFGSWDAVVEASREMGRVLKPGGLLTLSTELRLAGPGKGPTTTVLTFSPEEICRLVIAPSGLRPIDDPAFEVSQATRDVVVGERELRANTALAEEGKETRWKTFPHIVLESGGYRWTSMHLALTKD
jgi:SAM-dependent methyltransferase